MKIYDISQEIFSCEVYPGDPAPKKETILSISGGDVCNLTAFSMCAHNGTHIDAPYHFIENGKTVDSLSLKSLVGYAFVVQHDGVVTADDAKDFLERAELLNPQAAKRILIKGKAEVSLQAAQVFAQNKVLLLGNESQTVGPESAPMAVHKVLLVADTVLLEGIRLKNVPEGVYLLNAAPLNLFGADGAPCRALLIDTE
ncbi:MAG: cyclase family protein [Oscillospiraceae bacterium]|nr:cyclase family protein [Oscillospiraceae bacterium]